MKKHEKKLDLDKKAISRLQLGKIVGGANTVVLEPIDDDITTLMICTNSKTQRESKLPGFCSPTDNNCLTSRCQSSE